MWMLKMNTGVDCVYGDDNRVYRRSINTIHSSEEKPNADVI